MDVSTAQTYLNASLANLSKAEKAKAAGIADGQVTHHNLEELRAQVTYWQRVVDSLTAKNAGGSATSSIASWT